MNGDNITISRKLEQGLSLERCECYVAHLRALLHMYEEEDGTSFFVPEAAGSLSFLLNALEVELHYHARMVFS